MRSTLSRDGVRRQSPWPFLPFQEVSLNTSPLDPRLLEILVCPVTKGPLTYDSAANELISRSAGLAYPIRDGIPIMLPDEARQID